MVDCYREKLISHLKGFVVVGGVQLQVLNVNRSTEDAAKKEEEERR